MTTLLYLKIRLFDLGDLAHYTRKRNPESKVTASLKWTNKQVATSGGNLPFSLLRVGKAIR